MVTKTFPEVGFQYSGTHRTREFTVWAGLHERLKHKHMCKDAQADAKMCRQ